MNLPRRSPVAALATLVLLFPLLTLTAGCDGGSDPFGLGGLAGTGPTGSGTASLSWVPPLTRTDGAALTDLAGYRILYGTSPHRYTRSVSLRNPGITRYVVEGLGRGTWYFVVTAFDRKGLESSYSAEVHKTIE